MLIGYVRSSKSEETDVRDMQYRHLTAAGVEAHMIYEDRASEYFHARPALHECVNRLQAGDELHVCQLDRIGSSLSNLISIVAGLIDRGVNLYVHDISPFDKSTIIALAKYDRVISKRHSKNDVGKRGNYYAMTFAKLERAMNLLQSESKPSISSVCVKVDLKRSTLNNYLTRNGELTERGKTFFDRHAVRHVSRSSQKALYDETYDRGKSK